MCLFCDIASGSTAAEVVHETEHTIAFLDIKPLFHGHTLVIPRSHHETLTDLPPDLVATLFTEVQQIAGAVREALGAVGTFVAMNNKVSQSVPHLHVHVVPRRPKDGLRGFFWPRTTYNGPEQMAEVGDQIREALP